MRVFLLKFAKNMACYKLYGRVPWKYWSARQNFHTLVQQKMTMKIILSCRQFFVWLFNEGLCRWQHNEADIMTDTIREAWPKALVELGNKIPIFVYSIQFLNVCNFNGLKKMFIYHVTNSLKLLCCSEAVLGQCIWSVFYAILGQRNDMILV